MRIKEYIPYFILVLICLGTHLRIHGPYFHDLPFHKHAWTQADQVALSLGFSENGFDFFTPQTANLRPECILPSKVGYDEGWTRSDLPIHPYLVALIAGNAELESFFSMYRIYSLFWGLLGVCFLFGAIQLVTKNAWAALGLVFLICSSKVFLYYFGTFLPSVFGMYTFWIALYFMVRYYLKKDHSSFWLSILFLSLATLIRPPYFIFLGTYILFILYDMWKNRQIRWNKIGIIGISFAVIAFYTVYSHWFGREYGSIFLSSPKIPQNFDRVYEVVLIVIERYWNFHLSIGQYVFALFFIGLILFVTKVKSIVRIFIFPAITTIGLLAYGLLLTDQFVDHDYYALDTIVPFFIIWSLALLLAFQSQKVLLYPWLNTILFVLGLTFHIVNHQQVKTSFPRHTSGDYAKAYLNFKHCGSVIDQFIGPNDRVMVLSGYSTNIPLIMMDRRGYCFPSINEEIYHNYKDLPYEYMVLMDEFTFKDIYPSQPDIVGSFERIGGNGMISIYKKDTISNDSDPLRFIGCEHPMVIGDPVVTYLGKKLDQVPDTINIPENVGFPLNIQFNCELRNPSESIKVVVRYRASIVHQAFLVLSAKNDQFELRPHKKIVKNLKDPNAMQEEVFVINPEFLNGNETFEIFVWNPENKAFNIFGMDISLY